jgi:hypothetical protein
LGISVWQGKTQVVRIRKRSEATMTRKDELAVACAVITLGAAAAAYAALPSPDVDPSSVPLGTLAAATPVNVLSVDAFTRAINQAHGSNSVLQHLRFVPGRSTGWHTHPGPNIVLVVWRPLCSFHSTERDSSGWPPG